jgi:predicted flap endonuclease-1-like 5' DNA nuclease
MSEKLDFKGISLINIEGIGKKYAEKLAKVGVRTTRSLLEKAATKKGRRDLADISDISEKLILEWVNLADLFRIKGVGEEYSDLLEEAGVDTVVELSKRRADNLYQAMLDTNAKKKLVRRPPALSMVEDWIKQAKKLPRVVQY